MPLRAAAVYDIDDSVAPCDCGTGQALAAKRVRLLAPRLGCFTCAVPNAHDSAGVGVPRSSDMFADIAEGNERFTTSFTSAQLTGYAARGLAIVTCMDSRIEPLKVVGMTTGDAKILRNAGARVTEDVLRTLILATHLLGVTRVLVMPHTDCRMSGRSEAEVHAEIMLASGVDTRSAEIRTVMDQLSVLRNDVQRIRAYPLLAKGVQAAGAVYDVRTGRLDFNS